MTNEFRFLQLNLLHQNLKNHSMYKNILSLSDLKIFMENHVFAVWDFMSLLKRLQNDLTCVSIPWKPVSNEFKEACHLINAIVLGEESDMGPDGLPIDHFSLYVKAMEEIGASTSLIYDFINAVDFKLVDESIFNFTNFNLDLAKNAKTHEVCAAFFYGREKLIPDMFQSILNDLKNNLEAESFKHLIFYLERHIELDGGDHSHKAYNCLSILCGNDEIKWQEAILAGENSLKKRIQLWNDVDNKILINRR
jgi:hypothetical protein